MKPTLFAFLYCLSFGGFAQTVTPPMTPAMSLSDGERDTSGILTPYNPNAHYHTWSIKGKVLPYLIGNAGGISTLVGLEYGIGKHQSIGIDGFLYYYGGSDDNVTDTAGVEHDVGKYDHTLEKALFLNYRYYFGFRKLREKHGITPYLLAFLRYGYIARHEDQQYTADYVSQNEKHSSAGIMLGSTFAFRRAKRLGLDVNFGMFEKQKVITTVYRETGGGLRTDVQRPLGPGFRLSVNLSYWFLRKEA